MTAREQGKWSFESSFFAGGTRDVAAGRPDGACLSDRWAWLHRRGTAGWARGSGTRRQARDATGRERGEAMARQGVGPTVECQQRAGAGHARGSWNGILHGGSGRCNGRGRADGDLQLGDGVAPGAVPGAPQTARSLQHGSTTTAHDEATAATHRTSVIAVAARKCHVQAQERGRTIWVKSRTGCCGEHGLLSRPVRAWNPAQSGLAGGNGSMAMAGAKHPPTAQSVWSTHTHPHPSHRQSLPSAHAAWPIPAPRSPDDAAIWHAARAWLLSPCEVAHPDGPAHCCPAPALLIAVRAALLAIPASNAHAPRTAHARPHTAPRHPYVAHCRASAAGLYPPLAGGFP